MNQNGQELSMSDLIAKRKNGELLSAKEAEEQLKIKQSTLRSWLKRGKIRCYDVNSKHFYLKADLELLALF